MIVNAEIFWFLLFTFFLTLQVPYINQGLYPLQHFALYVQNFKYKYFTNFLYRQIRFPISLGIHDLFVNILNNFFPTQVSFGQTEAKVCRT